MSNITDAVARIRETREVLTILGLKEHAAMLDRPIELLTKPTEVVAATATDWEVSHVDDQSGKWTFLQVYDPDYDAEDNDAPPVVNVSLSDVEAADLAKALIERTNVEVLGVPDV